jgi:hypothetical protein
VAGGGGRAGGGGGAEAAPGGWVWVIFFSTKKTHLLLFSALLVNRGYLLTETAPDLNLHYRLVQAFFGADVVVLDGLYPPPPAAVFPLPVEPVPPVPLPC